MQLRKFLIWAFILFSPVVWAENPLSTFDGALLVTPFQSNNTVLISHDQKELNVWKSEYKAVSGARLLPDGSILRVASGEPSRPYVNLGLRGGRIQRIGWNGELLWDFWNAATYHMVSSDAIQLPNGNILMAVVEYKSQEDSIRLGRTPEKVSPQGLYAPGLMEFTPLGKTGGKLVWRWSAWEHLYQNHILHPSGLNEKSERIRKIDINTDLPQNGMSITEIIHDDRSDTLLLTLPILGEIWRIDHSTSSDEAKDRTGGRWKIGGDILWRGKIQSQDADASSSKIISADWADQDRSHLTVLTSRGKSDERFVYSINSFICDPSSHTLSLDKEILRWAQPHTVISQRPNSITRGPDHTWFIGHRASGMVEWISEDGNVLWKYSHQQAEQAQEANANSSSRSRKLDSTSRAATLNDFRYYPANFLNLR